MPWVPPMECCRDTPEKKESRRIAAQLKEWRKQFEAEVKLLLLGAGDSGKSTLAKQMKIIHMKGFSNVERNTYKALIVNNIISSMKILVSRTKDIQNTEAAVRLSQVPDTPKVLTPELARDVKELWADSAIQSTLENATFYIMENIKHYFDDIDRIVAEGYVPSDEDILKSRAQTAGIYETEFDMEGAHFKMIDVGGQRTERRKWVHCFDGVTAVLFCVAMSEYDQLLFEDGKTLRMEESLNLFKEVCTSPFFAETAVILFLNKEDIFREKIARVPLTRGFPEYTGPNEYGPASEYIRSKFGGLVEGSNRLIYPHFTTATNTQNITVVFKAVRDIVLRTHLIRNGMLA